MLIKGYVGVAGTIGVGKSTLTVELAEALGFEPALEDAGANPYLPDFYKDMHGFVTKMQIWFLSHRVSEHRRIVRRIREGVARGVVKDRTVWEDIVFAKMFNKGPDKVLSDLDYQTYLGLFENMVLHEPMFPELLIHLACRPETALERIHRRGRPMETGITLDYLKALRQAYGEFLDEMRGFGVSVLRVEWEEFLPLSDLVALVQNHRQSKQVRPAVGSQSPA
jgi:deoxyadenosine/deoxycytidine kinase